MYASVSARDADSTRRRGDPGGLAAFAKSATAEPTDSDHPAQAQGWQHILSTAASGSFSSTGLKRWLGAASCPLAGDRPQRTAKCADWVTSCGPPELD